MKRKGVFVSFLLLTVTFLSGCTQSMQSGTKTEVSNKMLMQGTNYLLFMEPEANAAPIPEISIAGGTPVALIEVNGDWSLVAGQSQSGWLPSWYIINENDIDFLTSINSDYMVVKENVQGLLFPGGPSIKELEKGMLVKPTLSWQDWIQVSIILFDIPAVSSVWIKDGALTTPADVKPIQGFVRVGSPTYDYSVDGSLDLTHPTAEKVRNPMPVAIVKTEGEFSYVTGPGGWGYWVKASDIIFNID